MTALHNVGADAPGQTAPERTPNDEPRELAGNAGPKGKAHRVSLDSAAALRRAQLAGRAVAIALWAAALALAVWEPWL